MTLSQYVLIGIIILIPVIGFISTLSWARKAETTRETRWRKGHGILFWVAIPTVLGFVMLLSSVGVLPRSASLVSVILFACTTLVSWLQQRKRDG